MKNRITLITGALLVCALFAGISAPRAQDDQPASADKQTPAETGETAVSIPPAAPTESAATTTKPSDVVETPAATPQPTPAVETVEAPQSTTPPAMVEAPQPASPVEPPAEPPATPAKKNGNGKTAQVNGGTETVELAAGGEEIKGAAAVTNAANKDLISITLDDVEMADVVRMFTRISGANIIASPSNLLGRVTVNLVDVEWKPAFESILDMHSLALTEKRPGSGVYSIIQKQPGAPEPMVVETIFLKYASVSNVVPVVTAMVADRKGIVSTFPSKNALVIRTTSDNLSEVKQIIMNIDKLRDQVFIEAKFMELSDEAIKDLGINWQSLQAYSVGASSLGMAFSQERQWDQSRADTSREWDRRQNNDSTIKFYDEYGQQFEVSSETWTEAPPGSGNYSVTETITPTRTIEDVIDQGKELQTDITDSFAKTIADARTAVLSASDFQVILSALKQVNGVSIVSNPKIIVANEQPATIHIGQTERPFVSSVTPGQQGIAPVVTYNPGDPVDTGVKLTVTPTVNTESNITVKIEPELTRFVKDAVAPNGQTYPIVGKKKISTVFCLENGKTVAIGGLTETTEREEESKIPFLGDIPIIGKYLFSYSHTEKLQDETIIFVTVGLATPETIQKDHGLPEETDLAKKRMLLSDIRKQERDKELKELKESAESDTASAMKVKERLLKRTK